VLKILLELAVVIELVERVGYTKWSKTCLNWNVD